MTLERKEREHRKELEIHQNKRDKEEEGGGETEEEEKKEKGY